jgi:hydrogenase maturation protease
VEASPEDEPAADQAPPVDSHGMHPQAVLGTLQALGGRVPRVLVVACEPEVVTERMGLSEAVAAAVDHAAEVVRELAAEEVAALTGPGGATKPLEVG